jgi:hypothetical protein
MLTKWKKLIKRNRRSNPPFVYLLKLKDMSCSGGKSTKKGRYNKADNLKKPTGYTVDKNGNVKPKYN